MSSFSKDYVSFKDEGPLSTLCVFLLRALHIANNSSKHLSMGRGMDMNILPSPMYRVYRYGIGEVQTVQVEHEPYHSSSTFQMKALSLLN